MRRFVLTLAAGALAACVNTMEMPIAPNKVRINTEASGWLFQGAAVPSTMVAAAKATLARGYTHFRFDEAGVDQGSEITGASLYGGRGFAAASVNRVNVEKSVATVTMFNVDEPGAKGAFEAVQVLAQYQPHGS